MASLAGGQTVQDQKHGGGVVVDDRRIFRTGQLADERTQMVVALAALSAVEIEFKRHGLAHGRVAASMAVSASKARPRLVCRTVPVRLNSGRSVD